jgi:hypothetical protein
VPSQSKTIRVGTKVIFAPSAQVKLGAEPPLQTTPKILRQVYPS